MTSPNDIVRYDGQLFSTGGTAHLHNMIEGDPGSVGLDPTTYPSGVVELVGHKEAMEAQAAAHTGADVTVHFVTFADAEAARDLAANHAFSLLP